MQIVSENIIVLILVYKYDTIASHTHCNQQQDGCNQCHTKYGISCDHQSRHEKIQTPLVGAHTGLEVCGALVEEVQTCSKYM